MHTLDKFGDLTGLQINMQKSEVMGMGRWADNPALEHIGLKVVDAMKVTGIIICKDPERQLTLILLLKKQKKCSTHGREETCPFLEK